jgi:hypothetical protein
MVETARLTLITPQFTDNQQQEEPMFNLDGSSIWSNSNSFGLADKQAKTLPWFFRVLVPGMECGWPPAC